MKLLRIIIILLVTAVTGMASECCDCPEPVTFEYVISSLTVENIDNSGEYPVVSDGQSIKKEAYGIQLQFSFDSAKHISRLSLNLSLIQTAQAVCCFCDNENYALTDSIVSFRIFSETDFNSVCPAGSDISEYFRIYKSNYNGGEFVSITDQLSSSFFGYEMHYGSAQLICYLMVPPPVSGEYRFRVEALLSDGNKFTETVNATLI